MMVIVYGSVENLAGKGENAGNQHFLLFPQGFLKAISPGLLNHGIVWYRVIDRYVFFTIVGS